MLHESPDDAEQLMNLIRNSGQATRGQMIETSDSLGQVLQSGSWDLMLLRPEANDIFAMECLKEVQKQAKDIPAILLIDDHDHEEVVEGLREGYLDVVQKDHHDHLLLVIKRELQNLADRRARRNAELHLKETEKRCAALLDSSRDAITYVTDGMHTYANEAYLELFGYEDAEDLEGMPIMDMVSSKDHEGFKHFLRAYSAGDSDSNEFLCHGLCTDGTEIQARMVFSNASYDGEPCTQILIRTNQADAELEERLREISSQDLLTGLYNRSHFAQELDSTIQWAIDQNKTAVLLYIEIDNFDAVQSEVGISGADMVLSDVATLLRETLSEQTMLARFGDDIFTAVVKEKSLDEGQELAETIRVAIEDHLSEVQERTVQVTSTIGVTIISESADNSEEIVNRAHQACEQVKEDTPLGNGVGVFDPAAAADIDPDDTGAVVQDAIDKGLFKLLFQPVIGLRGGSGELYEVFLRMVNQQGEEVSPNEFLSAASQQDLGEKIDRWVILQSIKLLSDHRANGNDTRVIINITGESLKDHTLLPWLSVALKAARMPSDAIVFQFSESDATTYMKQAKEFCKGLKELHCKISSSRFGCALNPFNTLKHVDVDYLKVDGSFMKDISNEENREALKEMVAAAHAQGKLTIAPFVESASILSTLWQIGVNYIQGYYLQAPSEQMNYDFSSDE